jgi:hypothetical protein
MFSGASPGTAKTRGTKIGTNHAFADQQIVQSVVHCVALIHPAFTSTVKFTLYDSTHHELLGVVPGLFFFFFSAANDTIIQS